MVFKFESWKGDTFLNSHKNVNENVKIASNKKISVVALLSMSNPVIVTEGSASTQASRKRGSPSTGICFQITA